MMVVNPDNLYSPLSNTAVPVVYNGQSPARLQGNPPHSIRHVVTSGLVSMPALYIEHPFVSSDSLLVFIKPGREEDYYYYQKQKQRSKSSGFTATEETV
jgi:hypothetical protein